MTNQQTSKGYGAIVFVAVIALMLLCSFSLSWNLWLGLALIISLSLSWLMGGFLYYQFWGRDHKPDWKGMLIGAVLGVANGGVVGTLIFGFILWIASFFAFFINLLLGFWCGLVFVSAGRACTPALIEVSESLNYTPILIVSSIIFGIALPWLVAWWKAPPPKEDKGWRSGLILVGAFFLSLSICVAPVFFGFLQNALSAETSAIKTGATEKTVAGISTATFTPTPTPTITPTPTPLPTGYSRKDPFPRQSVVTGPVWEVEILEDIRGSEATDLALSLNQYNDVPPDGHEYILLRLRLKNVSAAPKEISPFDFKATGDRRLRHSSTLIPGLEPRPEGELESQEEIEGWVAFEVETAEDNLSLLINQTQTDQAQEIIQYLAIDEGASVLPPNLNDYAETALGTHKREPASFGQTVTVSAWQAKVLSVVRGERAWEIAQEANQFNDPPPSGMELVLVKIWLKYVGQDEGPHYISSYPFSLIGEHNIEYDTLPIASLKPALNAHLYPGGETEGWIPLQTAIDETDLKLIFQAGFDKEQRRYLSLQE